MILDFSLRFIPLIGYLCLQGLLIADVIHGGTGYAKAGVVSLLASFAVYFLFSFAECIRRDDSLQIESHWGGLGGGVGGFRISRSLIYLAGALCFGLLIVLAYYPRGCLTSTPPESANPKQGTGKASAAKPDTKKAPE